MNKRILSLVLALVMVFSLLAGCGDKDQTNNEQPKDTTSPVVSDNKPSDTPATPDEPVEYVDPYADMDYYDASMALYDLALGEFYEAYEAAKAADNVSERYALMAIAEAKLMESGVFLPLSSNGGNYAISRVAPYTAPNALWGNDSYRYHNVLVTTEPIKTVDRDEMKAKYVELKTTGTYIEWAEEFLANKGYQLKDSYTFGYSSDPQTWDVLATSKAADSEAIINTYDGLMEYDAEGILQPALAESYSVSADGTVYTFKIRQGLSWVDSQGRKVADVKADDFVAGMQHMMDAMGGLEYLIQGIIVNATEYITGDVTDFAQVGVKAVDDYTLQYTLCQDTPFFLTMLGYGVFAPMSRSYYESQGGKFGADYDSESASYTYGKTPDSIAYCGPYLVTNSTAENTIVFSANPAYWNADGITMKTITWKFNDGQDTLKAYNDTMSGTIDGAGLNASSAEKARTDGVFEELAYVSACDATSFCGFYNINRAAYANINDGSVVSPKAEDPEQQERAVAAMRNASFRRALSFGLDRASYNAQVVGEELKLTSLRNCYTPGNFVFVTEDTTVDINGTATTFPAGTYYGAIMQAQIDADGIEMTVWDPAADGGAGSSDGYDGWYNPAAAAAELAVAIEELAAIGIEVSAENPVYIDLPYYSGSEAYGNRANALKQSIESALGGAVVINLCACEAASNWYYAGYYCGSGEEMNFDIYDVSGWGPDYGDPQTYLDTMLPDYAGYMTMMLGIF